MHVIYYFVRVCVCVYVCARARVLPDQPDKIVICVNTERDICNRCVGLETDIAKLTSYIRQSNDTTLRLFPLLSLSW